MVRDVKKAVEQLKKELARAEGKVRTIAKQEAAWEIPLANALESLWNGLSEIEEGLGHLAEVPDAPGVPEEVARVADEVFAEIHRAKRAMESAVNRLARYHRG